MCPLDIAGGIVIAVFALSFIAEVASNPIEYLCIGAMGYCVYQCEWAGAVAGFILLMFYMHMKEKRNEDNEREVW